MPSATFTAKVEGGTGAVRLSVDLTTTTTSPMKARSTNRKIRHAFFVNFWRQLHIIWPMLSGIFFVMIGPGFLIGYIEGWKISDSLYFTFVTGLTIGYGDLVPRHIVSRFLAIVIGFSGVVLASLLAAVSVRALNATTPTE
jgi:hypothetical protein